MTTNEIKKAVMDGKVVHWSNESYRVVMDENYEFLIKHRNGHCIGLTWADGMTLNGEEEDFYIVDIDEQIFKEQCNSLN